MLNLSIISCGCLQPQAQTSVLYSGYVLFGLLPFIRQYSITNIITDPNGIHNKEYIVTKKIEKFNVTLLNFCFYVDSWRP